MRKAAIAIALLAFSMGPPQAKVVNCSMTAEGMVDVFLQGNEVRAAYPQVLVFDRDGGLVFNAVGGSTAPVVQAIHRHAKSNAPRVEPFAAYLRTADGKPVDPASLKGTATVVELGASWCRPCHAMESELRRLTGITLLLVDADTAKHTDEIQVALKKRLGR
jgi:hypothetical protein